MNKVVSFQSSRGGTGKTIIAVNLATLLAQRGLNVALIDLDFRAPSLRHVFSEVVQGPIRFWVNDYLNSRCKPNDYLIDVHKSLDLKGNLMVGFADPSLKAIEGMLKKGRLWEARALKKLLDSRKFLFKDRRVNLCIYDTSPGIQYSSLNAIICSDAIVFVATSDPLDLEGLRETLTEFSDIFENKTSILLNKVFPETDNWSDDQQKGFLHKISTNLKTPVIGAIPCYCDVLKAGRNQLLLFGKTNHPFIERLEEVAQKLAEG